MPDVFTLSDFLVQRSRTPRQTVPWLQFYELTLENSVERYVSLYDAKSGASLPNKISFDGQEWTYAAVKRTKRQEASNGERYTLDISIGDLDHQGAFLVQSEGGFAGQLLRIWTTTYDRIDTPGDAYLEEYDVAFVTISQGPDIITVRVGDPSTFEARYPRLYYDRAKCLNNYPARFTVGNFCRYPSNDFLPSHYQDLRAGARNGIQARKNGWSTQWAPLATEFEVAGEKMGGQYLWVQTFEEDIGWIDEFRLGPHFFRVLTGDFDVHTRILFPGQGVLGKIDWFAGLIIQDEAPSISFDEEGLNSDDSDWLIWGIHSSPGLSGSTGWREHLRVTEANVSTDTDFPAVQERYARIRRVGQDLECYSKANETDPWTLRTTETLTLLPSSARVGLVLTADDRITTVELSLAFEFLRFDSGGLATCNLLKNDPGGCSAHENIVQNNSFERMPRKRPGTR